jgi:hypothetical protein
MSKSTWKWIQSRTRKHWKKLNWKSIIIIEVVKLLMLRLSQRRWQLRKIRQLQLKIVQWMNQFLLKILWLFSMRRIWKLGITQAFKMQFRLRRISCRRSRLNLASKMRWWAVLSMDLSSSSQLYQVSTNLCLSSRPNCLKPTS